MDPFVTHGCITGVDFLSPSPFSLARSRQKELSKNRLQNATTKLIPSNKDIHKHEFYKQRQITTHWCRSGLRQPAAGDNDARRCHSRRSARVLVPTALEAASWDSFVQTKIHNNKIVWRLDGSNAGGTVYFSLKGLWSFVKNILFILMRWGKAESWKKAAAAAVAK